MNSLMSTKVSRRILIHASPAARFACANESMALRSTIPSGHAGPDRLSPGRSARHGKRAALAP